MRDMGASRLVVVSNRGPYRVKGSGARRHVVRAAGGLVTALDPMLRRRGGVWVSAQETDHPIVVDARGDEDRYDLAQVGMTRKLREAFYGPVSNGVLWPTLHSMPATVELGSAPWESYREANRAFAQASLESGDASSIYWIHDYHLMLVPMYLREKSPDARIGWFCHIPWPGPDLFAALPWRDEMLEGLLGADLIGFHTEGYARQFLACVAQLTDHEVDDFVIRHDGRTTRVVVAPIGVPFGEIQAHAESSEVRRRTREIRRLLYDRKMILGVDRLDYTKGVPERLRAFAKLLKRNPGIRRKVVLVQVMVPSREAVRAYRDLKDEVDRMVGDINGRYAVTGLVPVHYFYRSLSKDDLYAHYRAADVALVTPLRDGMNLVAHEYCASRLEETGALVLSEFAGSAHYMPDALLVNPHDVNQTMDALLTALRMPPEVQRERMRALRAVVKKLDVHGWAERYLQQLESNA